MPPEAFTKRWNDFRDPGSLRASMRIFFRNCAIAGAMHWAWAQGYHDGYTEGYSAGKAIDAPFSLW